MNTRKGQHVYLTNAELVELEEFIVDTASEDSFKYFKTLVKTVGKLREKIKLKNIKY